MAVSMFLLETRDLRLEEIKRDVYQRSASHGLPSAAYGLRFGLRERRCR